MSTCSVDGCISPHMAKGFCSMHYMRNRKGIPLDRPKRVRGLCSVENCGRPHAAKGYCDGHFRQSKRGRPLSDIKASGKTGRMRPECTFTGCTRAHRAGGFCNAHYQQKCKGQELRQLREDISWRIYPKSGYVYANYGGKRHAQHRVVMAEMIGRELLPHETPHHINGVRHDNRPENLELWVKSQPAGQRAIDLLAWAREIINTYEGLEDKL